MSSPVNTNKTQCQQVAHYLKKNGSLYLRKLLKYSLLLLPLILLRQTRNIMMLQCFHYGEFINLILTVLTLIAYTGFIGLIVLNLELNPKIWKIVFLIFIVAACVIQLSLNFLQSKRNQQVLPYCPF